MDRFQESQDIVKLNMEKLDLENQNQNILAEDIRQGSGVLSSVSYGLGICGILLFILALVAGAIAYIVFGIMYLVQDYDIAHDCKESNLWAYVLTAIILAWIRSGAKNTSSGSDSGITFCMLVCLGIIEAGLAIWGGIELWQNSCDDLRESNLWKFGLATFCLQTICAGLFLIVIPFILYLWVCK